LTDRKPPSGGLQNSVGHITETVGHVPEFGGHDAETGGHDGPKYAPTGRCAEITKQRDLSTKGQRIGFRLDTVHLGLTKWGAPATSCVVVPTDAPVRTTAKKASEVGGAILEMLSTRGCGIKKGELVAHFEGRYPRSSVYRELKQLVEAGKVHECIGIVAIAGGAKGAN
jgi:putative DNA primase/helicase